MKRFDAVYSVSDRPKEDFSMEEPKLPEWRKKTSGWTFTITNIYTPDDTDKTIHMSKTIRALHTEEGNHET